MLQPVLWGGIEHAEYTIGVQGCGRRATYVSADDASALRGLLALSQSEGIIPALEPSHALGYLLEMGEAGKLASGTLVILNLSGRGDKDMLTVASALNVTL